MSSGIVDSMSTPAIGSPETIASVIRKRCGELGLAQNELARGVGLNVGHLSRKINGKRPWKPSELAEVARVLRISLDKLCGRRDR